MKEKLQGMADEFVTKAKFVKVDMTEPGSIVAEKYDVITIPATLIIKDGEVADTIVGDEPDAIRTAIQKAL
ncbi:MAG: thioredoxin family protein [Planctomycetaceae bacterium]